MAKELKLADLKLLKGNRDLSSNHIKRLKEQIEKNGYFSGSPIIADENGFILDGQHRYQACKELKIEPVIVVVENKHIDLIPTLNSTQLKWTTADYVKYYAAKGLPHFFILENICKSKGIKPNIVYNIVFNKTMNRTGVNHTGDLSKFPIKNGTFQFPDISDKGLAKLERKIDRILTLINNLGLPKTDRLIIAITRLMQDDNFSFDIMNAKIEYQKSRIYRCATIMEYMQMLANIYNNKNTKKITV